MTYCLQIDKIVFLAISWSLLSIFIALMIMKTSLVVLCSHVFMLVQFFQYLLQFVFWVGVYTKTIRQLGLVVSEQIVNSGCALVDYQLIDNLSSLSNC